MSRSQYFVNGTGINYYFPNVSEHYQKCTWVGTLQRQSCRYLRCPNCVLEDSGAKASSPTENRNEFYAWDPHCIILNNFLNSFILENPSVPSILFSSVEEKRHRHRAKQSHSHLVLLNTCPIDGLCIAMEALALKDCSSNEMKTANNQSRVFASADEEALK